MCTSRPASSSARDRAHKRLGCGHVAAQSSRVDPRPRCMGPNGSITTHPLNCSTNYRRPPSGIHTWSDRLAEDEMQTDWRHPRNDACANGARPSLPLSPRQGCRRHRRAGARNRSQDKRHRTLSRALPRSPRHHACAHRPATRRCRCRVSPRNMVATSPHRAGFPPPQTQIAVYGGYGELVAVLDMGWEDIKLAIEYDGDHHRSDRRQFNKDIRRAESLAEMDWILVRVTAEDTAGGVIARVSAAWARRTCTQRDK